MKNYSLKFKIILILIFIGGFFGWAGNSEAKDLFVATTGNDSVTYANNDINNSWATPAKAWCNADTGDTVYFRGGTYTISATIDTRNCGGGNGTADRPITFTNYQNEPVTLDGGTLRPVIDIEKSWNIIRGITTTGGQTFFRFGANNTIDGGLVENCTGNTVPYIDNAAWVYVGSHASNITVRNCTVVGPGTGAGVNSNVAAILVSAAPGFKIENCDLSNAPKGIYYKHPYTPLVDSGITFKNNYIHDCAIGISSTANYALIENNIIANSSDAGIDIGNDGGGDDGSHLGDRSTFRHNTIMDKLGLRYNNGPRYSSYYNIFRDNIFRQVTNLHEYNDVFHETSLDFNLYPSGDIIRENRINYTLPSWKIHNQQRSGHESDDNNSISATPIFAGGTTPSTIAGFALAPGSPGKNAGSDGEDIGADVTLVGVGAGGGADNVPPGAPSGLSVI